jgi:chemotaxis protein MotB
MSHKKPKAVEPEEHVNHERWMVTYADMVTLLMVLFIIMFAISAVDQKKFAALSSGLAESFGSSATMAGEASVLDDSGAAPQAVDLGAQIASEPKPSQDAADGTSKETAKEAAKATKDKLTVDRAAAEAVAAAVNEQASLQGARRKIQAALKAAGLNGKARIAMDEQGLTVSLVTDTVFFAADRATIQAGGRRLLDAVAPALRELPNPISVEGHTNTVPVAPKYYPSEWELSSARAVTVTRYLIERRGVSAKRLEAAGYADQHPLLPASDPRASTVNRRVDLVVRTMLTSAQRTLINQATKTAG